MRILAVVIGVVFLAATACSSSAAPQSTEEFQEQFESELSDEIEGAGLPADLEALALTSMNVCLDATDPSSSNEIDGFTECFAESLCSSDLVAPVWQGDTETCEEEAKASFDFGG